MSRQTKAAAAMSTETVSNSIDALRPEALQFENKEILLTFLKKTIPDNKPALLVFYEKHFVALCSTVRYKSVDYTAAVSPDSGGTITIKFLKPHFSEISNDIILALSPLFGKYFARECSELPFFLEKEHLVMQGSNSSSDEFYALISAIIKRRYEMLVEEYEAGQEKVAEAKKRQEVAAAQLAQQVFQSACEELRTLIEKHQKNRSKSLDHAMTLIGENTDNCKQLFSRIQRPTKKMTQEFDNLLSDANRLSQEYLLLAEATGGKKNTKPKPKIDGAKAKSLSANQQQSEKSAGAKAQQQVLMVKRTAGAAFFSASSDDGSYEVPDLPLPIPHGTCWADIEDDDNTVAPTLSMNILKC